MPRSEKWRAYAWKERALALKCRQRSGAAWASEKYYWRHGFLSIWPPHSERCGTRLWQLQKLKQSLKKGLGWACHPVTPCSIALFAGGGGRASKNCQWLISRTNRQPEKLLLC